MNTQLPIIRSFMIMVVVAMSIALLILVNSQSYQPATGIDNRMKGQEVSSLPSPSLLTKPAMHFVKNHGQAGLEAKFHTQAAGHTVMFCENKVIFHRIETNSETNNIELNFINKIQTTTIEGTQLQEGYAHFYKGSEQEGWQSFAELYGSVVYKNLYPGIDMGYVGIDGNLETEFYLDSGTDPGQIKLKYQGVKSTILREDGALVLDTKLGQLVEKAPIAFQENNGVLEDIEVRFTIDNDENIGFELGEYDHGLPLVIDPELLFLATIGPSWVLPLGSDVVIDSEGNLIVAGLANRFFPATDTIEASNHEDGLSSDGLLLKLNGRTGDVIWSALFGGKKFDEIVGIAIDQMDNIFLTGTTSSSDFPVLNPFQSTSGGDDDAFMAILNSSGVLTYSTYIGGSSREWGQGIAIDDTGNVFVAGLTHSNDFPVLNGFQMTHSMDIDKDFPNDIFVAKINSSGTKTYATYLGGTGSDRLGGIAVNASGEVVVSSNTTSPDFPLLNAYQDTFLGGSLYFENDIAITKFNASGNALMYSTYLGGTGGEFNTDMAVDIDDNVIISGYTESIDFPVIGGSSSPEMDSTDGIIALFNNNGQPVYSIRSNIPGPDQFHALTLDPQGMPITIGAWKDTIRFYEKPLNDPLVSTLNVAGPGHRIAGCDYSEPYLAFTGAYWDPESPRFSTESLRSVGCGNVMYGELPPFDISISGVILPDCNFFDSPFTLNVSLGNAGSKSIDNYSVEVQIQNMADPSMPPIEMTSSYENLPGKGNVQHEISVDQHIGYSEYVGPWRVDLRAVFENDINSDNNSWSGSSKNVFTRDAIADMVIEMTSDSENSNYATTLSLNTYPIGTILNPFGIPDIEYVFENEAYFALNNSRELGRMQHPLRYITYDFYGTVLHDQVFDLPPKINGEVVNLDPFIPDFLIDGYALETETKTDPEELINEEGGGSTLPSIDPDACLILVSGEIINLPADEAFERDINSLEQQFLDEKNGHKLKPEQIIKLIRPTPEELDMKIQEIKDSGPVKKTIYFIYSGHGFKEDNGGIGLRSNLMTEEHELYSHERLAKALKGTAAPRFKIIIDACYSGLATTQFQEEFWDIRDSQQELSIYTSSGDSLSANSTRMKHNGERVYYSQYLFRWMQGYGAYDPNGDGLSSFEECHLYSTWSPALNSVSPNYPEDEISLWRDQKPRSYKNGAFFVAHGDEKMRLGDTAIKIISEIKDMFEVYSSSGVADDVLCVYSEILGLPAEATSMAEGVEEVLDYRHWILDIETTDDSTDQDIFILPDLDFGIEHSFDEPRNLGVVYLDGSEWRAIPSLYNPDNSEVQVSNFKNYGTIALAYTDSSITTSLSSVQFKSPSFSVYPNPTNGPLNLICNCNSIEDVIISVFNTAGIVVSQEKISAVSEGQIIPIRGLLNSEPGLYLVEVSSNNAIRSAIKVMRQ